VHLTRRQLLEMAALMASAPRGLFAASQANDKAGLDAIVQRASETIRTYSAEGFHRTAIAVDRASADALLARARSTGATASLEPFDLSRVDPIEAFVQVAGRHIDGLPMFDGPFTGDGGVSGRLGPLGGDQPIAWTRIPPNGEVALRKMRQGSPHRAIVAVTMGGKPGLCPVNAGWFNEPFGPPVVQVSSESLAAFEALSLSAAEVRVVSRATRQTVQAFNVVSEIRGTDATLPPVCVMTPRSGWHANASERGGGLACWLEIMRAVVAARGCARTVKFVASSGHELGHLGLHDYLHRNPTLARGSLAWVHLGANIGTSTGDTGMTPSDARLRDAALHAFAPHGLETIRQSSAAQVGGEAATIKEQDGHFISFIGVNAWFHNPLDLWPDAVDIQAVARFARAVSDLTLNLANTPA
jgi:hypothetical protein